MDCGGSTAVEGEPQHYGWNCSSDFLRAENTSPNSNWLEFDFRFLDLTCETVNLCCLWRDTLFGSESQHTCQSRHSDASTGPTNGRLHSGTSRIQRSARHIRQLPMVVFFGPRLDKVNKMWWENLDIPSLQANISRPPWQMCIYRDCS